MIRMDKRTLKRKLWLGLGWSASIAVGAGALAAVVNIALSYWGGYLEEGGALVLGGTLLVMLSAALFTFPIALIFFWLRDLLAYRRKKQMHLKDRE